MCFIFYFILQDLSSLPPIRSRDTLSSLVILNKVFHSNQATPLSKDILLSKDTLHSRDTRLNKDILPNSSPRLSLNSNSKGQYTVMTLRVDSSKMSRMPASGPDLEIKPSGGTSSAECTGS